MAGKSRFLKSLSYIIASFDFASQNTFTEPDLYKIFTENRQKWSLPAGMAFKKFIEELLIHTKLEFIEISSIGQQSYTSTKINRYSYGASVFEVALSIRANTHLSHYSSVFLHGLTQQIPKVIYLTFEQTEKPSTSKNTLSQSSIDNAFAKPQREPNYYYSYLDYRIILLNSKFTKKAGVTRINSMFGHNLAITSLERTLIDITVRPAYSGGIYEVLKAYVNAKNVLSVNKLTSILHRLNFIYPYQQAIGFYLQKAGYKAFQTDLLKAEAFSFDFYLTYNMTEMDYSKDWRLHYPKNF